jgi:hypothetical protein
LLEEFAALTLALEQEGRAARLCSAAEALRKTYHAPLSPSERSRYAPLVTQARAALGKEAFATTWAAGRALGMEWAIEEALNAAEGM